VANKYYAAWLTVEWAGEDIPTILLADGKLSYLEALAIAKAAYESEKFISLHSGTPSGYSVEPNCWLNLYRRQRREAMMSLLHADDLEVFYRVT
jgi:hypothetical protein